MKPSGKIPDGTSDGFPSLPGKTVGSDIRSRPEPPRFGLLSRNRKDFDLLDSRLHGNDIGSERRCRVSPSSKLDCEIRPTNWLLKNPDATRSCDRSCVPTKSGRVTWRFHNSLRAGHNLYFVAVKTCPNTMHLPDKLLSGFSFRFASLGTRPTKNVSLRGFSTVPEAGIQPRLAETLRHALHDFGFRPTKPNRAQSDQFTMPAYAVTSTSAPKAIRYHAKIVKSWREM